MDETDRTTMIHFARSNHFYSSRRYELTSAVATASDSRMDHPKSSSTITAAPTSGFFKFLARFSGRRRISYRIRRLSSLFFPFVAIFLILSTVSRVTDACSSRTTPKPRPPSPTARPNITFHTYKCPPAYAAWYCLNDATCFTVKIGDSLLYNCECADGYMGPRCEYKDLDGSYLPTRPRVMLETASIASGAIVAVVLATIVCCYICVHKHQQKKRLELEIANGGVDTVDGVAVLRTVRSDQPKRPFGSHHLRTIPMSESLKR
ncbi:uncharacterized protein LOC6033785 [Culex quinquefasciatus]|uniref:Protein spitz n=4 Tax=Culex pipiens TaxID=7175 RepID=A0A8D8G7U1_CULPI|nr:uncharacterized protein LOC6033785 [Culex quinquefasciatus]